MKHPLFDYLRDYGSDMNPLPPIAGSYAGGSLIVCGDAAGIWRDLEALGARRDEGRGSVFKVGWDIMTVNKAVETMPALIEHAYSNEPLILGQFIAARRNEYVREFGPPRNVHACNRPAPHFWPLGGHGTSGLGAALVGIGLGYTRIALCGLPLDDGPHNGEPHWRRCTFTREAADNVSTHENGHWARARKLAFAGKVRSMSGRTRDWLGDAAIWL